MQKPPVAAAVADVADAAHGYRIWHLLAMQDIRQRYRRSTLGPIWITLSTLISIFALSIVYTKIFKMQTAEYLPFLAAGIVLWTFMSSIITESCNVFIHAESMIKQVNLPFGIYVGRMVWRNMIILAHNLVVVAAVLAYAGIWPGLNVLLFIPALVLVTVAGTGIGYLMGGLCTRFRDVPQIVLSLMQVLFYVTPVIWQPVLLKGHEELLLANPAYHYLEILRQPILGHAPAASAWLAAIALTAAICGAAMLFLVKYRRRLAFWL